ncbi:GYF domain-containing protein [Stieleria sp. TO1_6]|uniref:DUF4339 domain-containing protein n=1 Tax=Stieleria tagensis TaxID=2956795 RepID=UPI00209A9E6A|nr:GYF domain-containing protein [Stieleria tagensis]MCO8122987.1 GYF domain-containing protein [Stieleria tagensis]
MTQIERVFIRFRGRTIGPLTPDKVKDMVRRGQVTRMHELSGDGLSWMKADEFGNFFPRAAAVNSELTAGASSVPPGGAGAGATAPSANDNVNAQWYAHVNGEKQGPVSLDQMRLYQEAKILKKDSLVWKSGMDAWKPAAQALPELFGGAAVAQPGGMPATVGSAPEDSVASGSLAAELSKHHGLVLALGIALLIIGAVLVIAQALELNQGGRRLRSDYLSAALRIPLGGVLVISGAMALQAAGKLKSAAESSTAATALAAAEALNKFWLFSAIGSLIWIGLMLLIVCAAFATDVPVNNVLM